MNTNIINWEDFEKVEIRVGTIISAEDFEEAIKPAYKITADFGKFGIKKSSAQITKLYSKEELTGKQIIAVTNFPPKQIANFMSEFLILGIPSSQEEVILLTTDKNSQNGKRIF